MQEMSFATEWDMCWFCDCCMKMIHWKTKGYKVGDKRLCKECSELSRNDRNNIYMKRKEGGHGR